MTIESLIARDVLRELSADQYLKLFRNQVGQYQTIDGRVIRSGLCNGSSDYVGWRSIVVTPEMVGQRVAVFTALEFKTIAELKAIRRNYHELKHYQGPDKKKTRLAQQINFIEKLEQAGGKAGFVSSIEEGRAVVK